MNIVSKTVADAWIKRYKKEMSKKEYTTWRKNFDQQTIVREVIDGVVFMTRDYVSQKELAQEF
jgi:hypothetical protein